MITRRNFTAGAATLLAAGHISTRARAATVSWDMSTVWPDGNFHTQNAMAFAEELKKQSGGSIAITVKAGGQLGFKGPEHLRVQRWCGACVCDRGFATVRPRRCRCRPPVAGCRGGAFAGLPSRDRRVRGPRRRSRRTLRSRRRPRAHVGWRVAVGGRGRCAPSVGRCGIRHRDHGGRAAPPGGEPRRPRPRPCPPRAVTFPAPSAPPMASSASPWRSTSPRKAPAR